MKRPYLKDMPDSDGYFGEFGGNQLPKELHQVFKDIENAYYLIGNSHDFVMRLRDIRKHFQGRPTPVYYAKRLTEFVGGARIYLKREDLNHTGAHKLNHCMGEALLAKYLGKKKLIAETGAGQHGVAVATAAAYFGLECEIHMGEVDIEKEYPNVQRMKILGAKVVPVTFGQKTLKEAVDSSFGAYLEDLENSFFAIGSVVGPHPYPMMVRDFQHIVGIEAREQFLEMTGNLPDNIVACVGGGSNAMGIFSGFIDDYSKLWAVEPMGRGEGIGENAASLKFGKLGNIHGFKSMIIQDEKGEPAPVYSVASGLDYQGVGPEHAYLNKIKRTQMAEADDKSAIKAFYKLSQLEGIIPALESSHAVAFAMELAKDKPNESILINLSGRGDKDLDFIVKNYPIEEWAN